MMCVPCRLIDCGGMGFVFALQREYVNAWGWHCIEGALFDTVRGTVQTGAFARCTTVATAEQIARGALEQAVRDGR